MWFCPLDGTLLQLHTPSTPSETFNTSTSPSSSSTPTSLFVCATCPYSHDILDSSFCKVTKPKHRKVVDDILGGAAAWENVDRTAAVCPNVKCGHNEAFFMQMQIRSADEPMSVFYKCCKCGNQWNDK